MRRSHVLTQEQIDQLRAEYHGKQGERIIFAERFNVSSSCIGYWAHKLHLIPPGQRKPRALPHAEPLTDARRQYLLLHYTGQNGAIKQMAEALGVRPETIKAWVRRLGLSKRRQDELWTEAEYAYLRSHLATDSYAAIALQLGRTVRAIIGQACRLGLRKRDAGYTLTDLMQVLCCDAATVQKWVRAGWLQGDYSEGKHLLLFREEAVQRFLRRYPQAIAHLHFDYLWVHDLLVGGAHGIGELARPETEAS